MNRRNFLKSFFAGVITAPLVTMDMIERQHIGAPSISDDIKVGSIVSLTNEGFILADTTHPDVTPIGVYNGEDVSVLRDLYTVIFDRRPKQSDIGSKVYLGKDGVVSLNSPVERGSITYQLGTLFEVEPKSRGKIMWEPRLIGINAR